MSSAFGPLSTKICGPSPSTRRAASASPAVAVKNSRAPAAASARAAVSTPSPYASALMTAAQMALGASFWKKRQFSTMASAFTRRRAWRLGGDAPVREVAESGVAAVKEELHLADGSVALFA